MSSKNDMKNDTAKLDAILAMVREEVLAAGVKHGPFKSSKEGYAVILKELDTLWDQIKADFGNDETAMDEALQVAAMGVRYILDLSSGYVPGSTSGEPDHVIVNPDLTPQSAETKH